MSKPEKDPDPLFNFRMSHALAAVLDDLRRDEPDLPTRSEMVRRCIQAVADQRFKGKRK